MEKDKDHVSWANKIIRMFNSKCAICSSVNNLHAHHIAPKAKHPELKYDLNNGIALCHTCHMGKNNPSSVHAILRSDPILYESLMKESFLKRDQSLREDS